MHVLNVVRPEWEGMLVVDSVGGGVGVVAASVTNPRPSEMPDMAGALPA